MSAETSERGMTMDEQAIMDRADDALRWDKVRSLRLAASSAREAYDKAAAQGVLVGVVHDPRARRAWDAYEAAGKEIV